MEISTAIEVVVSFDRRATTCCSPLPVHSANCKGFWNQTQPYLDSLDVNQTDNPG